MDEVWQFLLLGLGTGAVYVLLGQGIVVIHRGSRVTNFAQGAFALIGAYAAYGVESAGLPVAVGLLAAVMAAGGAGALTQVLVIRHLAAASALTRVIATLGVLTLVSSTFLIIFQDRVIFPDPVVANDRIEVFGGVVGSYSLVLVAVALTISLALWAVYRYTLFGLLTTAVAENPRSVAAQGRSPERIALGNWAAGAALGGLAGALIAPTLGLSVATFSLLLVPSLAAALLGGFRSFWLTAVGGMVVGVAQSELVAYDIGPGWTQAVPFVLITVVLVIGGRSLPDRGEPGVRLPGLGSGRLRPLLALVVVGAILAGIFLLPDTGVVAIATTAMVAIVLVSSVVVTGYAGQVSLAQWALAGVGGFLTARTYEVTGWNFLVCIGIGALLTLPVGMAFGTLALRSRGVTLAIITLGLAVVVESVLFGNPDYTGGIGGISLPSPSLFGVSLDPYYYPSRYALLTLLVGLAAMAVVRNLRRSPTGRQLIAVRSNERAAAALGIGVGGIKLYAFAVGAVLAGLGGGLLVFRNVSAVFTDYTVGTAITLFSLSVMGGIGYLGGSWFAGMLAVGGVGTVLIQSVFNDPSLTAWLGAASGLGVLLALTKAPDGIAAQISGATGRLLARRGAGSGRPSPLAVDELVRPDARRPAAASPVEPGAAHLLAVTAMTKSFGGVQALRAVDLSVSSGEIVGLIGANGAGKTTLIDAVSGMTRGYDGSVTLDGASMDRRGPAARARRGIGRSFQSLELFDDLTVLGNIQVACQRPGLAGRIRDLVWPARSQLTDAAKAAIESFDLLHDLDRYPHELSYGRRRLVGIARAVAADPAIVLLDEPAAGLDEHESQSLARLLRELVDRTGLGVLLVEHDVNLVMGVSDRVVALHFGQVIAEGRPEEVRHSRAVVEAYLGVAGGDGALVPQPLVAGGQS